MLCKITQQQVGNGIGTILASIGIPMILDAFKGRGVGRGGPRMGKTGQGGPQIGMPMYPPPYIGTWGRGKKEKKKDQRARCTTREKQSIQGNTNSGRHIIGAQSPRRGYGGRSHPVFQKTVPMSNFDLLEWCQYLKIPIKNVLSRDQNVPHNHKLGLFIYNLEPSYMNVSHWVATCVRDNVINYFDSFGVQPFQEIVDHAKRKKLDSTASKPTNTKPLY